MSGRKDPVEEKLEEAMPWVGVYIAAASAVCTIAMAADAFNGFRSKRLWFPSKYFSLNAATLTLLAVAMKLPLDINTNMFSSPTDWLAKYMGLLFMSTAMANFMSCLGSMGDKVILVNMVALAILVITISANVLTQLFMLIMYYLNFSFIIMFMIPTILMIRLLVKLVSIAIMVPTIKRRMEAKYQELHKLVLMEEDVLNRREDFVIDNLRRGMMKYWMMAETSNPQFVMARSVVCTTSVCFFCVLTLIAAYIFSFFSTKSDKKFLLSEYGSSYKRSTVGILVIQSIGVAVGAIAPTLRWYAAVSFKCSAALTSWKGFKKAFKIESYWTQILMDCRDCFSDSLSRKGQYRKCLHDAKRFALTCCIGHQIFTLRLTKLFFVFPFLLASPFFLCFIPFNIIVNRHSTNVEDLNLNLKRYVLLLEGEAELPNRVLKKMCDEANNMIQTGRKKQPQYLVHLLRKFVNFNGVAQFDSDQIPSLHSHEPPNCWMLPVVTLTSIAIALPNIPKHKVMRLLSSVSEGLSLVKLIVKTLDENAQLVKIRRAADICWVGVVLYTKWHEVDLRRTSLDCKNFKEVLLELSNEAEGIVTKFKNEEKDPVMENPLNWPAKVVSANSMYRITRTILLSYEVEEENEQTDEGSLEQLCVMIADILAACLTNLPRVITTMCHRNAIEKREKNVRKAFLLLGETEQVVELVQQKEWPHMSHDKAAYIEEWRALLLQSDHNPSISTSSDEVESTSISSEEHLTITVVS